MQENAKSRSKQRNCQPTARSVRGHGGRQNPIETRRNLSAARSGRLTASLKVSGELSETRAQERAFSDAMATRDPNLARRAVVSVEDIAQAAPAAAPIWEFSVVNAMLTSMTRSELTSWISVLAHTRPTALRHRT